MPNDYKHKSKRKHSPYTCKACWWDMFYKWDDKYWKLKKENEELKKELEYLNYIKKEVFDKKGVE